MQHATHGAIKAMVLHEEAIVLGASTPSETHMRDYMTTVGGEPSRTQAPPLEGEGEQHSSLKTSIQVRKLCTISRQTLVT